MDAKLFFTTLISGLFLPIMLLSQNQYSGFSSPLPGNTGVSSVFGEPRADHFHSGIDFRTNSDTGMVVVAPYDGWVSRIKIGNTGYGNTVYIDHPNGYTTVYGHLERFSQKLEQYVDDLQYQQQKWDIEDFPNPNQICIQKGDTIGYSGNTGGSTGPHMHYEVRITKSQNPIDPLSQGFFDLKDETAPQFKRLIIYEVIGYGDTMQFRRIKGFKVEKQGENRYTINLEKEINLPKRIAFGILADDRIDGQKGTFDITFGTLKQNGSAVFSFNLTEFSYTETRYANTFIDYEAKVLNYGEIIKLFNERNNPLSVYSVKVNNGVFMLDTQKASIFEIIIADHNRNVSSLKFSLSPTKLYDSKPITIQKSKSQILVNPMKWSHLEFGGIKVSIQPKALYSPAIVDIGDSEYQSNQSLCKAFFIGSTAIALQKSVTVEVNLKKMGVHTTDRIYLARFYNARKLTYVGGDIKNDSLLTAETRIFGVFTIAQDTIAPVLTPMNFSNGDNMADEQYLKFKAYDAESGIASLNATIDGSWQSLYYEPKEKLIKIRLTPKHLQPGITHAIAIQCIDLLGNKTENRYSFNW